MIQVVHFKEPRAMFFGFTYATLKAVEIYQKNKFLWDKKPQGGLQ